MAFSIRNARVEEKARAYAAETGTTLTGALERALDKALDEKNRATEPRSDFVAFALNLAERFKALPVLDPRSPDEILYDEDGIPH